MLRIDLSRQAAAFLSDLPPKIARQVAEKITALGADPHRVPSEVLRGYEPWRRAKSGEYRIIYTIDGQTLRVMLIGKRNDDDIYKALKRAWKP